MRLCPSHSYLNLTTTPPVEIDRLALLPELKDRLATLELTGLSQVPLYIVSVAGGLMFDHYDHKSEMRQNLYI